GTTRIDLRTRAANTTAAEPAPADALSNVKRELEKLTVRWHGVCGKEMKALVLEQDGERQKFVLHSWDLATARPGPPRELLTGRGLTGLPTVDGRFLCLRDPSAGPDRGDRDTSEFDGWSICSSATGELAARAPFEPGTQAIALVGPRVYVLLSGPIRGPI